MNLNRDIIPHLGHIKLHVPMNCIAVGPVKDFSAISICSRAMLAIAKDVSSSCQVSQLAC